MGERESETAGAAASACRQSMRIYIGGVGPTVTSGDVENTFSPLGRVAGVEFVRTNGRNFAYMDFEPHSEKTLAKLFSTYNGCTWKGGKLKLERAKEHYLDRLKREWEEDAKITSEAPEAPADLKIEKAASNSNLVRLNLENMQQLRIFFPKLRKVKPLPFKGTGKHKYSFQRIEVPPLPIHFCDCEEHWQQSETASQKYISSINSGIHYDKELGIMNSVLNKLFSKENTEHTADKEMTLDSAENASDPYTNDVHEEESEEILEMDDDLLTNIGVRRTDDMLMLFRGDMPGVDQGARAIKQQSPKIELSRNKADANSRQEPGHVDASETAANRKAHSQLATNITENESTVIVTQTMSSVGYPQEPDILAQPTVNKDRSWLKKSSWKDLVEEAKKSSFSITSVLPGTTSLLPGKPRSGESAADKSTVAKTTKPRVERKKSKNSPVMQDPATEKEDTQEGQKPGALDAAEVAASQRAHSELPVKIIEQEFMRTSPLNPSSDGQSPEPEASAGPSHLESQTEPRMVASQGAKGQSWLQKCAWKDLVGGTGSSSFSITTVLPSLSALQSTKPKSSEAATDKLTEAKKIEPQPDSKLPKALPAVQDPTSETSPAKQNPPPEAPGDHEIPGKGDGIEAQKAGDLAPRWTRPEVSATRVCTFMRSDESMRQWSQAKAALSRRLHKKRNNTEDDGMQPRKVRQKMR